MTGRVFEEGSSCRLIAFKCVQGFYNIFGCEWKTKIFPIPSIYIFGTAVQATFVITLLSFCLKSVIHIILALWFRRVEVPVCYLWFHYHQFISGFRIESVSCVLSLKHREVVVLPCPCGRLLLDMCVA